MLAITAASRDPYAAADFTQGLLSTASVNSQWLALTPALVKAITTNTCEKLPQYRQSEMRLYNREAIYPDRIQAENTLCSNGVNSLVKLINNSTGVIFNNGEQDLTRSVLFDENNQAYPWTKALQTRPVVIGSGAGAAIQSGGKNTSGNIATITKGSSLLALQADINDSSMFNLAGGLATFNYGMIDTHFSEQNRTLRLATVLDKTQQKFGFGIDEATALVVIKSSAGNLITVIGKSGVVFKSKRQSAL
nr:cyanophycinase [Pseudoalteromonas sp. WY3]